MGRRGARTGGGRALARGQGERGGSTSCLDEDVVKLVAFAHEGLKGLHKVGLDAAAEASVAELHPLLHHGLGCCGFGLLHQRRLDADLPRESRASGGGQERAGDERSRLPPGTAVTSSPNSFMMTATRKPWFAVRM